MAWTRYFLKVIQKKVVFCEGIIIYVAYFRFEAKNRFLQGIFNVAQN